MGRPDFGIDGVPAGVVPVEVNFGVVVVVVVVVEGPIEVLGVHERGVEGPAVDSLTTADEVGAGDARLSMGEI